MRRFALLAMLTSAALLLAAQPASAKTEIKTGAGRNCRDRQQTAVIGKPVKIVVCAEVDGEPFTSHFMELRVEGPGKVKPASIKTNDRGEAAARLTPTGAGTIVVMPCDLEGCYEEVSLVATKEGEAAPTEEGEPAPPQQSPTDKKQPGESPSKSPAESPAAEQPVPVPEDEGMPAWILVLLITGGGIVAIAAAVLLVRVGSEKQATGFEPDGLAEPLKPSKSAKEADEAKPAKPPKMKAAKPKPERRPEPSMDSDFFFGEPGAVEKPEPEPAERSTEPAAKAAPAVPKPAPAEPAVPKPAAPKPTPPKRATAAPKAEATPPAAMTLPTPASDECGKLRGKVLEHRRSLKNREDRLKTVKSEIAESKTRALASAGSPAVARTALSSVPQHLDEELKSLQFEMGRVKQRLEDAERGLLDECGETLPPEAG
ncbi:MAG: hypothetical protein WD757_01335 [Actinomycetota bacterium]